jgi:hypothetical protein
VERHGEKSSLGAFRVIRMNKMHTGGRGTAVPAVAHDRRSRLTRAALTYVTDVGGVSELLPSTCLIRSGQSQRVADGAET